MSKGGFDAGIYHNGAVIYDKGKRLDGYGIKNPYNVAKNILANYSDTNIAIEADDVLYANFDSERPLHYNHIFKLCFKDFRTS